MTLTAEALTLLLYWKVSPAVLLPIRVARVRDGASSLRGALPSEFGKHRGCAARPY